VSRLQDLFATLVEFELVWLGTAATMSTTFHLVLIGKAGAAVHSDASRESHTSWIGGTGERRGIDIVVVC